MQAAQQKSGPATLSTRAHKATIGHVGKVSAGFDLVLFRDVKRFGLKRAYSNYLAQLIKQSSSGESDRRLAKLNKAAVDTFGSVEQADRWLRAPNRALGGAVPFKLAGSKRGSRAVRQILGRIEHGVYS